MSEQQVARPRRYVVGVDGSAASLEALRWAVSEAQVHGGVEVRAVLIWEIPYNSLATGMTQEPYVLTDPAMFEQQARQRLASAISAVEDTSAVEIHAEVLEGQPAAVLGELSRKADLVVVGSRGHGGFTALLLGSVGAQVVRHAHCSVVVIRPRN